MTSSHIGPFTKPGDDDWPEIPQGLHVVYPKWWPHAELEEYDRNRQIEVQTELTYAQQEAEELGLVGRGSENIGAGNWSNTKYCAECGRPQGNEHSWSGCLGALQPRWGEAQPCNHQEDHPEELLSRWQTLVCRYEAHLVEQAAKEQQRQEAQETFEEKLLRDGHFYGRLDKCRLPEGWTIFQSMSSGSRSNPTIWAFGPRMTGKQFEQFVSTVGDYSEVKMEGRFPVLYTPEPGKWIGRGGVYAQALAHSLSLRFLKIKEKK